MIIDCRIRPPYESFLTAVPYKNLVRTEFICERMGMHLPEAARQKSVDLMLKEMDDAGITAGIIPARVTNPDYGIVKNDDVESFVKAHSDRFLGFMGADPNEGEIVLDEVNTRIVNGALKGVVLECGQLANPLYADDKKIFPLYKYLEEHNIPVILMNGANAGPDMSYSNPLAIDHVAAAFPKLKIILSHGCWKRISDIPPSQR